MSIIRRHLEKAQQTYGISKVNAWLIVISPYVILGSFFFLISYPPTQDFAALMTYPNYPIEWIMIIMSFLAGLLSCQLALWLRRNGEDRLTWIFYLLFGIGLIWTAGEASAWGQQVLGYHTPKWMAARNAQNQMTL